MADVLSFRLKQRPVRLAAATSTLTVSLFYLLAQMAGGGGLVALLLDIKGRTGQSVVIAVVGVLMIVYVLIGGMRGTTWVQIIKAVLLISGAAVMTVMVLAKFGLDFSSILGSAQQAISGSANEAVANRDVLAPGAQYGGSTTSKVNLISLGLALVLGTAGLPHVLMRFYTVPTAKEARRSVVWAIGLIGAFYLFTLALGYGAAAIVGPDRILAAAGGQNSAAPLLAYQLGGVILLGIISAVAFATILAVVAGLTITASASLAHDVYASVMKSHKVTEDEQVRVSRITAVMLGILAIGLGILANGQNIAFLVALAFAVAAAANLPTILYSLYWRRFNTRGALWSMYGGLISTIVLIVFSPAVSGAKTAMIPNMDFAWFPLANPEIVSIPLAFILGIIGTLTSSERGDPAVDAEFEVRSFPERERRRPSHTDATDSADDCRRRPRQRSRPFGLDRCRLGSYKFTTQRHARCSPKTSGWLGSRTSEVDVESLPYRVAGALLLPYAQPLVRIAALKTMAADVTDETTCQNLWIARAPRRSRATCTSTPSTTTCGTSSRRSTATSARWSC